MENLTKDVKKVIRKMNMFVINEDYRHTLSTVYESGV